MKIKRLISIILCFILTFALCPSVFAAGNTMTFTGEVDTYWYNNGNWNPGQIPGSVSGSEDTAVIPEAKTVVVNSHASVALDCSGEVLVSSGVNLSLIGDSYLRKGKLGQDGWATPGNFIIASGALQWSGGSIEGDGIFTINSGTQLNIETNSDVLLSRSLVNNGQIMVNSGTLRLAGGNGATHEVGGDTGTFTVSDGANLDFEQKPYSIGGNFVNAGNLTIWDTSSAAFKADYQQKGTGTLALKVWGLNNFNKLNVTGQAELGGVLEVDFINDYVPQVGDTFEIMTCGSRTGEFASIISNGSSITFEPTYTDTDTGSTLTVKVAKVCQITDVAISGTTKFGQTLSVSGITYGPSAPDPLPALAYQWERNGQIIDAAINPTYTLVEADIANPITVTVTASGTAIGSVTSTATATVEKADAPAAPAAPTLSANTHNSVTLTGNPAYQFTKDNGASWQDSNVFYGLNPSTNYTFNVRIKETATHRASAASSGLDVQTPARSTSYSGDSGSSTPTTPAAPVYKADVTTESGTKTTLALTINRDSRTAFIEEYLWNTRPQGRTVITMPSIPDVDTYSLGIPVLDLSTTDNQSILTINTDFGSLTVPSNMLTGVKGADGNMAQITIGKGDKSNLPEDIQTAIGNRPLIQLTLSIDGNQTDWSNPDAPVAVSIPYIPTAVELANPESIVVWYIDGSGNVVTIPNGHYNPATGMVTFDTTHFSNYAVVHNKVSFKDVAESAWYSKAVGFIAARKITLGTGDGNFGPEAKLTRGQFIVMLMKAYDIAPDANPRDNFSEAGGTYYTGYLAAAKRLGISAGIGNNMFAPEKEITRQEMFTLLYNNLKVIRQLPQGDSSKTLDHFSDAGQIDSWAKEAMTLLVKAGTVGGNAGKLNPTSTTTRAEMAQVLYNILSK